MSLNIVIDADVSAASQKISKFAYEVKKSFDTINTVIEKTSSGFQYGTKTITKDIDQFSKASRNSLTALSLTLQDLPFGFIGIQNNLPGIIQGFTQMREVAKTGTSVLGQLGGALTGPAGLFLAFSAVSSVITIAVQKYGSLGGAIDALLGKQSKFYEQIIKLNKAYKDYNDNKRDVYDIQTQEAASTDGLSQKIKTLSEIVVNQNESYENRNSALNRLKEISKDYFGNLDLEKSKLSDIVTQVDAYLKLIKQTSITKAFGDAIGETSVQLAKQEKLLNTLKNELETIQAQPGKIVGKADIVVKDQKAIDAATKRYNEQNAIVQELRNTLSLFNLELDKSVKIENGIQAPIDAANAKIEAQKEAIKRQKEALQNSEKYWANYKKGIEGIIDDLERIRKESYASISAANEFNVNETFKRIAEETKKATLEQEKYRKGMEGIISALQQRDSFKMEDPFPFDWAARFEENVAGIQRVIDQTNAVEFMKQNFTEPMSNLFLGFIETGKFAFEEFGKVVLKTINQIVAKIIATGIINLLGSILFPNAIGGTKGILGAFVGAFNSVLGFDTGGVANPSFAGVGGASFGMSGQVNLVLRGQDLVGSLNRTNTLINRVG